MKLLEVLLVAIAIMGLYFGPAAYTRYRDPANSLGYFDTEVTGVSDEMMRRSPELKANFDEFRACMKRNDCDTVRLFAERDRIIAEVWPRTFDIVSVPVHWWSVSERVLASGITPVEQDRFSFFEELRLHGAQKLRNECVPRTVYRYSRREDAATYDTVGFDCRQQPERKRSG